MRNPLLGSVTSLLLGAGSVLAQSNVPPAPIPVDPPAKVVLPATVAPSHDDLVDDLTHPPAAPPCKPPCPPPLPRFWVSGEYLIWFVKDGPLPVPIVTTSGAPSLTAGFLGDPTTNVLFGDNDFRYTTMLGTRISTGYYFTDDQLVGVEAIGFFLQEGTARFSVASGPNGWPVLARPVNEAGVESAIRISFPGALAGGLQFDSTSNLWGAEFNGTGRLVNLDCFTLDALAGFRYLDLQENIDIAQTTTLLPGGVAGFNAARILAPNAFAFDDNYYTRNQFYGGQLGAKMCFRTNWVTLDLFGKVALGDTHEARTIGGSTSLIFPGGVTNTSPGGALAQAPDIGHATQDEFAVVPEVGIKVGLQLTRAVDAPIGYNFLYWSDVIRPGDQISRFVAPTQLVASQAFVGPGGQPTTPLTRTDFLAHGATIGISLRF